MQQNELPELEKAWLRSHVRVTSDRFKRYHWISLAGFPI